MKRYALLFGAALAALCISGHAQQIDPNKLADAVTAKAGAAKYEAVSNCMIAGKDAAAQVACVLGIALIEKAVQPAPTMFMAPPLQQPVVQEAACSGIIGCAFSFVGKGLQKIGDFADRNAIGLGQIYSNQRIALRQASASEKQAEYRRDTDVAWANGMLQLGTAGIQGTRDTAAGAFQVFASLPPTSVVNENYNLTGARGVQVRSNGTLIYNPVDGSYNPTNPAPRVCTTTPTGVICQ